MIQGQPLLADIEGCALPPGRIALWWLGQHSFVGKFGPAIVYFDPYLSPSPKRNYPPLLEPADLANAAIILGTHDHTDHIDRKQWPAMARAAPRAAFVIPAAVRDKVLAEVDVPPAQVLGIDAGETLSLHGLEILAVPAAHEQVFRDERGRCLFLGFIVRGHGATVYHAGDTCIYEGIHDWLRPHRPDAMLLPINGRDAVRLARNCIGNMTYQEAVDLAGTLDPVLAVPTHFDMFPGNTEDPAKYLDYARVKYPALGTLIPEHGHRMEVTARPRAAAAADPFLQAALDEARLGLAEGGVPIGSVLVHRGRIVGRGHNRRVQSGSPILHGEMDALANAGRQPAAVYRECTLYTTLSPCPMCTGAILLYGIPRVVVGEHRTFMGDEGRLLASGVEVTVVDDPDCHRLMRDFIAAKPQLWNEDIGV